MVESRAAASRRETNSPAARSTSAIPRPRASVTGTRAGGLGAGVARSLGVGLDDDALVVRAEADVDRRAVGLAHLDLPRRAVLRVALDRVGVPAGHELEGGGLGRVGAGSGRAAVAVVTA